MWLKGERCTASDLLVWFAISPVWQRSTSPKCHAAATHTFTQSCAHTSSHHTVLPTDLPDLLTRVLNRLVQSRWFHWVIFAAMGRMWRWRALPARPGGNEQQTISLRLTHTHTTLEWKITEWKTYSLLPSFTMIKTCFRKNNMHCSENCKVKRSDFIGFHIDSWNLLWAHADVWKTELNSSLHHLGSVLSIEGPEVSTAAIFFAHNSIWHHHSRHTSRALACPVSDAIYNFVFFFLTCRLKKMTGLCLGV